MVTNFLITVRSDLATLRDFSKDMLGFQVSRQKSSEAYDKIFTSTVRLFALLVMSFSTLLGTTILLRVKASPIGRALGFSAAVIFFLISRDIFQIFLNLDKNPKNAIVNKSVVNAGSDARPFYINVHKTVKPSCNPYAQGTFFVPLWNKVIS